jgi:tetratricopeptide (TPR) repeat protein
MYNPSSQTITKITDLIEEGNSREKAGKLDEAIACYRQVIELDPNSYEANQKLAELLTKQGNLTEAIFYYQEVVRINSLSAKIEINQTSSHTETVKVTKVINEQELLREAQSFYQQQNWQQTITLCQRIIEINPTIAEVYQLWGNSLQQIGQPEQALKLYGKALQINPNFAEVYANIGSIYARQKDWQQALNYYQKAVNLNPKLAAVYRNIAKIFQENGQNEQSIQAIYQASLIEPEKTTPEEYYTIGNYLLKQNQTDKAISCLRKSIEYKPDFMEAYQQLAEIAQKQGEWEQAGNYYRKIIELQAKNVTQTAQSKLQTLAIQEQKLIAPIQVTKIIDEQEFLKQAQSFYEQKNWQKTIILCQEIIQINPNLAEVYKLWGNTLQQIGQHEQALKLYNQALQINPNFAEVYANIGSIYARQKNWQQALNYYQKAVNLNPKLAAVYRNIAKICQETGQNESAIQATYQASLIEPEKTTPEEYYHIANYLLKQNQTDKAISCLRKAIEYNPDFLEAYQQLAEIAQKQGEWQQASNYYQKITELQAKIFNKTVQTQLQESSKTVPSQVQDSIPQLNLQQIQENLAKQTATSNLETGLATLQQTNSPETWANLGNMYAQKQQWEYAISSYKKALEINPRLVGVYYNLAQVYEKIGQKEIAANCWYEAYKLDPKNVKPEDYYNLGNIFLQQRKLTEAFNCYRNAIQIKSDFSPAYHQLGLILIQQKKLTEAKKCFQQAIQQNPQDTRSYIYLGEVFNQLGFQDSSIQCCLQVLKIDPNNWQAYHNLGNLYLKQEEICDKAADSLRQAIKINPNFSWSHHNLGEACLKLNLYSEAAQAFQKAIEINPDFHWSYYNLAEALVKLEEWEKAADAYSHAKKIKADLPYIDEKINEALKQKAQVLLAQAFQAYLEEIKENPDEIETYYKALEIQPDNYELLVKLGEVLLLQNKKQEAITYLQKARQINPYFVKTYTTLAMALEKEGKIKEAIAFCEKAISLKPEEDFAYLKLGQLNDQLVKQKYLSETNQEVIDSKSEKNNDINCYQKALVIEPNNYRLYLGLARAMEKQSRLEQAIYLYNRALELNPNSPETQWYLKQVLARKEKLHNYFKKATSHDAVYQGLIKNKSPQPEQLDWMPEIINTFPYKPIISLIVPVYNTPENFFREMIESVLIQTYPHWELCLADDNSSQHHVKNILKEYAAKDNRIKLVFRSENGHISAASNSSIELATGEYIALLDHDDLLTPEALFEVVSLLNKHPEADMIYSDEDKIDEQGLRVQPYFKPDWCPDKFLSNMYTCHLGVYRKSIIDQIGGFRLGYEGSQDYDLVLRLTEQTDNIFHIPKILYHWRIHPQSTSGNVASKNYAFDVGAKAIEEAIIRRGEKGKVIPHRIYKGIYTVRYEIKDYKLVSIIIPSRNYGDVLNQCLVSIFEKTTYPNYEVIVIDNGTDEPETLEIFAYWKKAQPEKFKCYPLDIPFNYSKLNNFGVSKAQGDYLLFLNNDTEVITPDWIEAMVEQAQRSSIGVVGVKLLYADDTIQHAGVVMGIGGVAGHSHKNYPSESPGYFGQLTMVTNYSAVTAACLMCRREVCEQVKGFDEKLQVAFNDVDFCLKVKSEGYNNVYLPHVVLYHHESKSRGYETSPEKQARFLQECETVKPRWSKIIAHDPCYNPNLTKNREDYTLNIDLKAEVFDFSISQRDPDLIVAFHFDTPITTIYHNEPIIVSGWFVPNQNSNVYIQLICNGEVVQKEKVENRRLDVSQHFFEYPHAKHSGFSIFLEHEAYPNPAHIIVQAVWEDGKIFELGSFKLSY